MANIGYDPRAVTIDGQRKLLISGSIHYPRSTPGMWPGLIRSSREAGLNTMDTYVFWNLHERRRGIFDFSGRLDLMRFCRLIQENGMHMILRIGPYICAETNYGGFPFWLRDLPEIRFRTYSEPFIREMGQWVKFLCDYLRPMFASQGGPIILAQIENEYGFMAEKYGAGGRKYLAWAIDLTQSLNLGIPLIMCTGSAPGAVETINGFFGHDQLEKHFAAHPEQPAIWTEAWTAWYDTFGYGHHGRSPESIAYGVARYLRPEAPASTTTCGTAEPTLTGNQCISRPTVMISMRL